LIAPISSQQFTQTAEARSGKVTICHRTKSITNPYRRITVSNSAVNSGHKNHTGGLWTSSTTQGSTWGDIIPDATAGGSNTYDLNFTTDGQNIFKGLTINARSGKAVCRIMSLKEYVDSERATGQSDADIVAELQDSKADEDLLLLQTLGLTFTTLTTSNLGTATTASQAVVVTTSAPTSVTTTSATLNGTIKTDTTTVTCHFEYDTNIGFENGVLNPSTATSVPTNTTTSRSVSLTSLIAATKYYYRHVCHDSGGGDLYGETFSFTTGVTYSLTYDSNTATSGSVPSDMSAYASSESAYVQGNAGSLVKTGYTFAGWSLSTDGSGTVYSPSNTTTIAMSSNRILYAKWSANSFLVSFDSNTATSGSISSQTYTAGTAQALTTNSFTKTGYTFSGWATTSSGAVVYSNSQSVTLYETTTVYAKWNANSFPVIFDSNTATSGSMSNQTYTSGTAQALTANGFAKSGSSFAGWATSANGSVVYTNSQSISLTETTTVYAKWTADGSKTVTFNSNYDTATTTTQSATTATNLTPNPFTRTGYTFGGWANSTANATNGVVAYANNASYLFTTDITLYAIWTINTHTITLTPTTANGSVSSSPAGISGCTTINVACVGTYDYGTSVTLTATPSSGYKVSSWTGDCSGSTTTCSLNMTANKTVGISYVITYTVTLGTLTNAGTGTILIDTSPATAASTITLTIQAEAGKQLKAGTLEAKDSSNASQTLSGTGPYTFTMPTSNVTVTAEFEAVAAGTYTITINSATGGSGSSSAATVSSGGSVTLTATASSGYTFSGWSCTGGGTLSSTTANPATLSNITSNATCTPSFTQNAPSNNNSGGGGGGFVAPRSQNKIVVSRITNTQSPLVGGGTRPVVTGTSTTLTPGNSANKTTVIAPTASTATSNKGGVIAVVTNNSPIAVTATTPGQAEITATNTTASTALEKRDNVPASVNIERSAEKGIQVSTTNGWTGRVAVAVINGESDSDVETFVEVVIAPTPVTTPQIAQVEAPPIQKPEEKPKPGITISWNPSLSEVVGYVVKVNSETVCFAMTTSCEITQLIGPKSKVEVLAQGNDNTFSSPVPLPAFKPARPIPALVVNFAVASAVLSPKFKTDLRNLAKVMVKEGFTKVDITGHTDSTGQQVSYDNQKLSDARAKATLTYLKRFVPKLQSVTGAYAFERRITDERTPDELYTNRRAEVAVS
jgi:uncharacterized repeat protein (TIGR02543 family)